MVIRFANLLITVVLTLAVPTISPGQGTVRELGLLPEPDPYPAPGFRSVTTDGKPLGTEEIRGKIVLLNFWATWCPPCRFEMPSMERLYQEFKGDGLEIVAVNFMESAETARSFMKESGFTFPVLMDQGGEISQRYGVHAIPVTFLIGRKGLLMAKSMGYKDWYTEKMRGFFRTMVQDGGGIGQPARAKAVPVTHRGEAQIRWMLFGMLALIFGFGVFVLWFRKASPRG